LLSSLRPACRGSSGLNASWSVGPGGAHPFGWSGRAYWYKAESEAGRQSMLDDIDVARSQFRQAEKASKRVLHEVGKAVGITPELILESLLSVGSQILEYFLAIG